MIASLRRSCNACAKAKHRCDLRSPRCSRCIKRNCNCTYANEPLTATGSTHENDPEFSRSHRSVEDSKMSLVILRNTRIPARPRLPESSIGLLNPANAFLDPFESYPQTRLPRALVQRLIHHFLTDIAFQYYPMDMSMESNPFVVSWWPRALKDPALFHVSLQTASLDEEVRAQNGFPISELLMADSVSLVRHKVENSSLAYEDETLNSIVTLAAIEHGKDNVEASRMHIEGVKRIVTIRGGIAEVKRTSPLTARMVSWVSLLVTEAPQFPTQDDRGFGNGVSSIPLWSHLDAAAISNPSQDTLDNLEVDPVLLTMLVRLRSIFHKPQLSSLTSTELLDLTCFVVHRLLPLPPLSLGNPKQTAISECLRYGLALYMLILHGTTYYSHASLSNVLIGNLIVHFKTLAWTNNVPDTLRVWVVSIGLASTDRSTPEGNWFFDQCCSAIVALSLHTWDDVLEYLEARILWMQTQQVDLFRRKWEEVLS